MLAPSSSSHGLSVIDADMREVDAVIARRLDSGVPLVGQVSHTVYLGDRVDVLVNTQVGVMSANIPCDQRDQGNWINGEPVRIEFSHVAGTLLPASRAL